MAHQYAVADRDSVDFSNLVWRECRELLWQGHLQQLTMKQSVLSGFKASPPQAIYIFHMKGSSVSDTCYCGFACFASAAEISKSDVKLVYSNVWLKALKSVCIQYKCRFLEKYVFNEFCPYLIYIINVCVTGVQWNQGLQTLNAVLIAENLLAPIILDMQTFPLQHSR